MRCLGIAPPSRTLNTRFCALSSSTSSKAEEKKSWGVGVIESMMRFYKNERRHTENDECPVGVEVWVFKERCKELVYKGPSKSDVGVMTVVCCVQLW